MQNKPKQKKVLTDGYDLRGNTIGRVLRHWLRMKTRIMGNYDTGPGLVCLVKLILLHWFGGPIYRVQIWLRSQYGLKSKIRTMLNKTRR